MHCNNTSISIAGYVLVILAHGKKKRELDPEIESAKNRPDVGKCTESDLTDFFLRDKAASQRVRLHLSRSTGASYYFGISHHN